MDLLAELRRRLDAPADMVTDEVLSHLIGVSAQLIAPWVTSPVPAPYQQLVDEATVQLAVKVYDVSARGVVDVDGFTITPSATPGLVRAVFGVLGPALATGGLSV